MLFHREPKIYLTLSREEYRLMVNCLLLRRNKLMEEGRYTDAIDEVLVKVCV